MKRTLYLAVGLVAVLTLAGAGFGQTAADHILKGDEYFTAYEDQKALDEYLAAVQLDAWNYEALWKAARGIVDRLGPHRRDGQGVHRETEEDVQRRRFLRQ